MLPRTVKYARPDSVSEAVELLRRFPDARPLAGGQSLVNVLKFRAAEVEALVDISRLDELRRVEVTDARGLRIGAGVRYRELAEHPLVGEHQPMVAWVASALVDVQVRNRGTLGGNLCYADPTSNFAPLMVAMGAQVHLRGTESRDVDAESFVIGPFQCDLRAGEIVHAVTFPALEADQGVGYASQQLARDSWAIARASAWVRRADDVIADARVVLGCVGPRPVRQPAIERALIGTTGDAQAVRDATRAELTDVDVIDDAHASGEYRLAMSRVQARRAIRQALGQHPTNGDEA